jgi:hypothetical protein
VCLRNSRRDWMRFFQGGFEDELIGGTSFAGAVALRLALRHDDGKPEQEILP